MEIQPTADTLPIGEVELTEEQLKELLDLGVSVVDDFNEVCEYEYEYEEEIPNE